MASYPWWPWWTAQFCLSVFVWIYFAPAAGRLFLDFAAGSFHSPVSDSPVLIRKSFYFVAGYVLVNYFASFLVSFHLAGLVLLLAILGLIKFRYYTGENFVPAWSDVFVFVPMAIAVFFGPVAIDSNFREFQFSLFRDLWPLDYRNRLDVHFAFPALNWYWLKSVPVMNLLSVQAPFIALVAWRALLICWHLLTSRLPRFTETMILLTLFLGSLYFRKGIHVKASPVGGLFILLSILLIARKEFSRVPVVIGLFVAGSLILGEYGGLVMVPLLIISLLTLPEARNTLLAAMASALLIATPELCRKIFIETGHFKYVFLFCGLVILTYFTLRFFLKNRILTVRSSAQSIFVLSFAAAVLASFLPNVSVGLGESFNVYQWSIQREGLLIILCVIYAWIHSHDSVGTVLLSFTSVQLLIFAFFRLTAMGHWLTFNPNMIWWNLEKDAMMIAFPLMTTAVGAVALAEFGVLLTPFTLGATSFYFMFFQDPLVKRVVDGPFAPTAPRMSAVQSLSELWWHARHKIFPASSSGNLVLFHLAVREADLVERIYQMQSDSKQIMKVCIDPLLAQEGVADFDVEAYSVNFPAGALGKYNGKEMCDLLLARNIVCAEGTDRVAESHDAVLCLKK